MLPAAVPALKSVVVLARCLRHRLLTLDTSPMKWLLHSNLRLLFGNQLKERQMSGKNALRVRSEVTVR
jgi:hypothetical protein